MNCFDCALFNKKLNICIEKHMGGEPEYYDKPKWMGCSWWKDPKEDVLTLFKEENKGNYDENI